MRTHENDSKELIGKMTVKKSATSLVHMFQGVDKNIEHSRRQNKGKVRLVKEFEKISQEALNRTWLCKT